MYCVQYVTVGVIMHVQKCFVLYAPLNSHLLFYQYTVNGDLKSCEMCVREQYSVFLNCSQYNAWPVLFKALSFDCRFVRLAKIMVLKFTLTKVLVR